MNVDWVSVTVIASSVATAFSLPMVALQLRALLLQSQVDAHHQMILADRALWQIALENESVAPNMLKSIWHVTDGGEPKEELFAALLIDHFEHAFLRRRMGLISDASWKPYEQYMLQCLRTPPADGVWRRNKSIYNDRFVAHFDLLLN